VQLAEDVLLRRHLVLWDELQLLHEPGGGAGPLAMALEAVAACRHVLDRPNPGSRISSRERHPTTPHHTCQM
jgi:hypothetical protein